MNTWEVESKHKSSSIRMQSNFISIILDGYINLGMKNNILKKKSDTIYSYNGECLNKTDEIRYSPVENSWKADIKFYLWNHPEDIICFIFSQYCIEEA